MTDALAAAIGQQVSQNLVLTGKMITYVRVSDDPLTKNQLVEMVLDDGIRLNFNGQFIYHQPKPQVGHSTKVPDPHPADGQWTGEHAAESVDEVIEDAEWTEVSE